MGIFSGKISAEFTPPKTWVLNEALSFTTDKITPAEGEILELVGANIENESNTIVTCEEGMKTDLASVPRICWAFIAPWDVARAAVIHDHLYATLRDYYNSGLIDKKIWKKARAISDKIFLLGMHSAEPPVPKWKKYSAYYSVRLCGGGPASKNSD